MLELQVLQKKNRITTADSFSQMQKWPRVLQITYSEYVLLWFDLDHSSLA